MPTKNEVAVRIDSKGRITLPKNMRKALGLKSGDTVFLKHEPENRQLHLATAVSSFDTLAEHAIEKYKEGSTKTVEESAREHGIRLNE